MFEEKKQIINTRGSPVEECMNLYCRQEQTDLFSVQFGTLTLYFCQACRDLYNLHKCCYFCAQIYSEDNYNQLDGQDWIQCDVPECGKWTHLECEGKNIIGIEFLIKDAKFKYSCPWCRIKKQVKAPRRSHIWKRMKPHKKKECEPLQQVIEVVKQSYFDDLLKKYGGYNQCVTSEEQLMDLERLKSLINR